MEVGFLQEIKSVLKSLVVSCPSGMTLDKLNRDYRAVEGGYIPFQKLGYSSLELFLKSIPDTLVVTGHGREARIGFVSNEKLQHINEMVSRQKNTTRDRKVAAPVSVSVKKHREFNLRQHHATIVQNTTYCSFNRGSTALQARQTYPRQQQMSVNPTTYRASTYVQRNHGPPPSDRIPRTKSGSESARRAETYRVKSREEDNREVGLTKIVLDKQNNTETITTGRSMRDESHTSRPVKESNTQPLLKRRQEDNNQPKPAIASNACDARETPGHNSTIGAIPIEAKSRTSERQLVTEGSETPRDASHRSKVHQPTAECADQTQNASLDSNLFRKLHIDPFSQVESSDNDFDEAVPKFAANDLVFRVDFPENMVPFGTKVPRCKLPNNVDKGAVIGVFISEIHSPFKFWFHIYKANHELDVLMNRIESFYRRLGRDDLVIPKTCILPGQVCAGLYNNMWHRAEILTSACNEKVKVHFFDYGTVSEVEARNVKYLPLIFANTPMQAIRGSLSHIKPISPLWPKSAIKEFLSMVSEVLLYAQIVEIDNKDDIVYMVLCDTNNGETVQINRQLVNKGFAKLDPEWDENIIAKNGYRKRHPREIFPTFEMLETGEYPSLYELEQLSAQGVDYEKISGKIVYSNLNNGIREGLVSRENSPTQRNKMSFKLLDTNPFKSDIISEIVTLKIFDQN